MQKSLGFTLIELLVVVLIIGILAAVALPQYTKAVEKSRAVQALTWLRSAAHAQEIYYMANGEYAPDLELLDITMPTQLRDYIFDDQKITNGKLSLIRRDKGFVMVSWGQQGAIYPGVMYCSAESSNQKAIELCRSIGNGVSFNSDSSWTRYRLN